MSQEKNVGLLSSIPLNVTKEMCNDLIPDAEEVYDKFSQLLSTYSNVHRDISSTAMLDTLVISELGTCITYF